MIKKQTNINTTHKNNNTKIVKNVNKITKINNKKIKNWAEYNKSLINRGNLSIFISESIIKNGRLVMPSRTGKPGRPTEYSDELIEFILTIRELFHLPSQTNITPIYYFYSVVSLRPSIQLLLDSASMLF